MDYAGTIEPARESDVVATVPFTGECVLRCDGATIGFVLEDQREYEFDGAEVQSIGCDSLDPRIMLLVVEHEQRARLVRFRSHGQLAQAISEVRWIAANAYTPELELSSHRNCPHCIEWERFHEAMDAMRPEKPRA